MKKGQKVVCLESDLDYQIGEHPIIKDRIYTIREVFTTKKGIAYRLEEIINPVIKTTEGLMERGYMSHLFAPVQEKFEKINFTKVIEMVEIGVN